MGVEVGFVVGVAVGFAVGVALHLGFELSGANAWYCLHGAACSAG